MKLLLLLFHVCKTVWIALITFQELEAVVNHAGFPLEVYQLFHFLNLMKTSLSQAWATQQLP